MKNKEIIIKSKTFQQWDEEYQNIKNQIMEEDGLDEDDMEDEDTEDSVNRAADDLFAEMWGFEFFDIYDYFYPNE